ncbi:MAG: hypothetical protein NC433_12000 [Clostridiales bacterium]|nr:hypothetical protein [Clostridiales bacterium]
MLIYPNTFTPNLPTGELLYNSTLFVALRAPILLGLSSICTSIAGRTRCLLEKQIKDSEDYQRVSSLPV